MDDIFDRARHDLHTLGSAATRLETAAHRAWDRAQSSDDYDRAKELEGSAREALSAYGRLCRIIPRALDALSAQERAYDRRVLSGTLHSQEGD